MSFFTRSFFLLGYNIVSARVWGEYVSLYRLKINRHPRAYIISPWRHEREKFYWAEKSSHLFASSFICYFWSLRLLCITLFNKHKKIYIFVYIKKVRDKNEMALHEWREKSLVCVCWNDFFECCFHLFVSVCMHSSERTTEKKMRENYLLS